ncbi:ergothioneine biosynthesis protein EgtB [Aquimarina hainanensis]|uniref:Ergothioneine biosynthesis protein EgtB n=1 Tax=Aquimarina hainanensis TaxID=1578017 RepID=A0ABW5NAU7_9FLAO
MRSKEIKRFFSEVRKKTEAICRPLAIEDYSVQPVVDVSPPKWHLAHTTWFFEQFILVPYKKEYSLYNEDYSYLFNSYYNNAGERVLRPNRGLMTRPTVEEVYSYRGYVTTAVEMLLEEAPDDTIINLVEIGIHHEQQHQELLHYDIKYILGNQPTFPSYETAEILTEVERQKKLIAIEEGVYTIGHRESTFCFDNELGVHKTYIQPFLISETVVTNGEYLEFIEDGGYEDFNLWHADGWDFIRKNKITAPLYWYKTKGTWHYYNGKGLEKINKNLPVMHVSYYEAFAFAEWKQMRLPTEFEWEVAASKLQYGQVWEWTASAYLPYPNFKKAAGALGEYNGKFMVNQHVLRGASVATSDNHSRITYRNFFNPQLRWMFSGIRLAK